MTSIFNGRWPEMSSFNIFIKTSHFDHLFFGFKQTDLCNSLKYSFSLQRLKYININSTVCIKKKKRRAHTCREHAQNTQVRTRYTETRKEYFFHWQKEGSSYSFPGTSVPHTADKTQKDPFVQRACFSLDFTVNYVDKTVFIYHIQYVPTSQIQTQKEALEKLPNEYTIKLTIILTMNYMMGIFYEL